MKQKYTSKKTSINKYKLPRVYRAAFPFGSTVLDYGCGRYVDHLKKKAEENGWIWQGYDPFNYPVDITGDIRYVMCSNVLNVIAEDEIVDEVIMTCLDLCEEAAVFTIYEGDKSGVGSQTGDDQWQRNEKTKLYRERIRALGYDPYMKGGMIWVNKNKDKCKN